MVFSLHKCGGQLDQQTIAARGPKNENTQRQAAHLSDRQRHLRAPGHHGNQQQIVRQAAYRLNSAACAVSSGAPSGTVGSTKMASPNCRSHQSLKRARS
ncbi:Uncharacterised protein [Raoultella terrigena]|uniref:Uncharacterized protein n=1 Tax=Raoultella terrigena TaxID=577 RepID=A0A4U9DEM9_RAOTE|nr:Uncharacterised protein [Raoultella terrigena]